jgi:ethanolamine ammonia-lyase small subunit
MSQSDPPVIANPWQVLRQFTDARIALGRAGVSLPTQAHLAFQLAHAQARDGVHDNMDVAAMRAGLGTLSNDVLTLQSAAGDRQTYLQRPDLGRRLDAASRECLLRRHEQIAGGVDLAVVVADGLSARAVGRHALPLLERVVPALQSAGWALGPLTLVEQGRVAIGDEVGQLLRARMVAVLIGERPGLSSPDSLGVYLTWMPAPGLTDASRNCISNIRPAGLGYDEAAHKLRHLLHEARRGQRTGIGLKDQTETLGAVSADAVSTSFLLPEPRTDTDR